MLLELSLFAFPHTFDSTVVGKDWCKRYRLERWAVTSPRALDLGQYVLELFNRIGVTQLQKISE